MNSMEKAADWLDKSERILIFTGAGISTAAGIPDFRSPDGLYSRVQKEYNLPYPEALFELAYFRSRPEAFYAFSSELLFHRPQPTEAHRFLADLEKMGKVELLMTQNIDTLHHQAGSKRILECHGSYQKAHCLDCRRSFLLEEISDDILAGRIPRCSCGGLIKPDIVFFGENLPGEFYRMMEDPPRGDLLLVLGTSLSVYPAAAFALNRTAEMPSILINRDPTEVVDRFDLVLRGDLDETIKRIKVIQAGENPRTEFY